VEKAIKDKAHVLDNTRYLLRYWRKLDPRSIPLAFLRLPVVIGLPILTALIPALMLQAIEETWEIQRLIIFVSVFSGLIALLSWLEPFLKEKMFLAGMALRIHLTTLGFHKILSMDYAKLEHSKTRKEWENVREFALYYRGARGAYFYLTNIAANLFGVFTYVAILGRLDWRLIAIVFATCAGEYFLKLLLRKIEWETKRKRWDSYARFEYLYRVAVDPVAAKDIRIFGAKDWLIYCIIRVLAAFKKSEQKAANRSFVIGTGISLVSVVRELAAYAFLIFAVLNGQITVADFIFFFGIVTGFSAWIMGLVDQYNQLNQLCLSCQRYRDFIEMPSEEDGDESIPETWETLELRDVSYIYEGAVEPTLSNIHLTIKQGERVSLVGANGAGKTTLVKILAGFYKPTTGEILLNGRPLWDYKREERFMKMAAIFQDYQFLPLSIGENITIQPEEGQDKERLEDILHKSDGWDFVSELENGTKSMLLKQVHKDAVEFSGGQKQRLLLARALYKRGVQLLILDEPTAALDPIAENKLYLSYAKLMENTMSFFVSHRLSSTQFCQQVLFMQDGEITEVGSHDELIAQRGDYWRMFETQAHYYKSSAGKEGDDA